MSTSGVPVSVDLAELLKSAGIAGHLVIAVAS